MIQLYKYNFCSTNAKHTPPCIPNGKLLLFCSKIVIGKFANANKYNYPQNQFNSFILQFDGWFFTVYVIILFCFFILPTKEGVLLYDRSTPEKYNALIPSREFCHLVEKQLLFCLQI